MNHPKETIMDKVLLKFSVKVLLCESHSFESPSLSRSKRSASGNCGTGVPVVVNYNPILCQLSY